MPAAQRVLSVLEILLASRRGMTVSEMARALGTARSSAFYLLHTIEESGYIYQTSPRGRYTFTARLLELANRSLGCLGISAAAAPFLRGLAQRTGLTVHLGIVSQSEVVLIDRIAPSKGPHLATWVGKRLPMHCTGLGKALMAYMPQDQIEAHLRQGLLRYNDNTIVSAARLKEDLLRVQARGFALDDEEETVGLRCIGAPLFDCHQQVVAAISVAGTILQLNDEELDRVTNDVKRTAGAISNRLRQGSESVHRKAVEATDEINTTSV